MNKVKHLTLHFTRNCNLKCRYCHTASSAIKTEEPISKDILYNILSKDIYSISFAGGEPFSKREELWELVHFFSTNGISHISITTNGTLLTENDFELCKKYNIRLQFSIDGCEHTHNFLRGKNVYKKAVKNLTNAISHSIRCDILYTVSNHTMLDVESSLKEFEKMQVKQITFLHFSTKGYASSLFELKPDFSQWQNFIKSLYAFKMNINILVQPVFMKKDAVKKLDTDRKVWLCNWHKLDYAYIDIRTGLVYPCGLAFDTDMIIGNVGENKLVDVCDAHLKRNNNPNRCNCKDYSICKSGPLCPAYKVLNSKCNQSEWMPICPFPAISVNERLITTV